MFYNYENNKILITFYTDKLMIFSNFGPRHGFMFKLENL